MAKDKERYFCKIFSSSIFCLLVGLFVLFCFVLDFFATTAFQSLYVIGEFQLISVGTAPLIQRSKTLCDQVPVLRWILPHKGLLSSCFISVMALYWVEFAFFLKNCMMTCFGILMRIVVIANILTAAEQYLQRSKYFSTSCVALLAAGVQHLVSELYF